MCPPLPRPFMSDYNFKLDTFLRQAADDVVAAGKRLYASGATGHLHFRDGLWTGTVEDQSIEIALHSAGIRRFYCSCPSHAAGEICAHLVAGALALNRELTTPADPAPDTAQSLPQKNPGLKAYLEELPAELLRDILHRVAAKNQRTALLIQAVALVERSAEADEYAHFLDRVYKVLVHRGALSAAAFQSFHEIMDAVIRRLQEHVSVAGRMEDVVRFVDAFLDFWPRLSTVKLPSGRKADWSLQRLMALLDDTMEDVRSPELVSHVVAGLCRHVPAYLLLPTAVVHKMVLTLVRLVTPYGMEGEAVRALRAHLDPSGYGFAEAEVLFDLLLRWSAGAEDVVQVIGAGQTAAELNAFAVLALGAARFDVLQLLTGRMEKLQLDPALRDAVEDYRLLILQHTGPADEFLQQVRARYVDTGNKKYFHILVEFSFNEWDVLLAQLAARDQAPATVPVLKHLGRTDDLLQLLRVQADPDLVMQADDFLFVAAPAATKALYEQVLTDYLDRHVGPRAVETVQRLFYHLESLGRTGLVAHLKKQIQRQYAHRFLLQASLS